MIDDHDGCEWVNVSSGTGSLGLSQTKSIDRAVKWLCGSGCVCACVHVRAMVSVYRNNACKTNTTDNSVNLCLYEDEYLLCSLYFSSFLNCAMLCLHPVCYGPVSIHLSVSSHCSTKCLALRLGSRKHCHVSSCWWQSCCIILFTSLLAYLKCHLQGKKPVNGSVASSGKNVVCLYVFVCLMFWVLVLLTRWCQRTIRQWQHYHEPFQRTFYFHILMKMNAGKLLLFSAGDYTSYTLSVYRTLMC